MGYTFEEPRKTEYTFYLAAKDRSGNYSEPASITVQHPGIRKIHLPKANVKEYFQAIEIRLPPVFKKTDIHGEVVDEEKEVLGYVLRMERVDENVAGDSETFIEERIPVGETDGRKVVEIPAGSSWEVQLGAYDSVVNKRFNPKEFEETFSDPVEASGAQISKIRDFVKGLQPVMLVEELPDLPHAEYPADSYVFRIPDSEDNEDYGQLYRNENGEWVEKNDPDLEEGMAAYPRVVAGTLQAGAISAHHIRSINADISEIVAGNEKIIINEQGIQHVDDYFKLQKDKAEFSGELNAVSGSIETLESVNNNVLITDAEWSANDYPEIQLKDVDGGETTLLLSGGTTGELTSYDNSGNKLTEITNIITASDGKSHGYVVVYDSNEEETITLNGHKGKIEAKEIEAETKNFSISHPNPDKSDYKLKHCTVETNTAGDNIYRYQKYIEDKEVIELPGYFKHLNENPQVWVNGVDHFGQGFGKVEGNELMIKISEPGEYNILVIGTRKDKTAKENWEGAVVPKN